MAYSFLVRILSSIDRCWFSLFLFFIFVILCLLLWIFSSSIAVVLKHGANIRVPQNVSPFENVAERQRIHQK